MRHHFQPQPVRLVHQCPQRVLVHRRHVRIHAVAPSVGEDLQQVRLVRREAAHGAARLAWSQRELRVKVAAPALHAVPQRRSEPRRHQHARPLQPGFQQPPHRLELLRIRAQIHHRRHPVRQIQLQRLAPIDPRLAARRQQVRVQVDEPGQQRVPFAIHHRRARRHGGILPGNRYAPVFHHHGHPARRRPAAVHHKRSGHGQLLRLKRRGQQEQAQQQPLQHFSILSPFKSDASPRE